jgi:hypothetical protein
MSRPFNNKAEPFTIEVIRDDDRRVVHENVTMTCTGHDGLYVHLDSKNVVFYARGTYKHFADVEKAV